MQEQYISIRLLSPQGKARSCNGPARLRRIAPVSFVLKAHLAAAALLGTLLISSEAAGPFIYVANAGEDTVSKIDISSNTEVARYATWFTVTDPHHVAHTGNAWAGPAPSRIAQDVVGNVYVLDRFFAPHLPVLLKIAPTGGIPGTTTSSGAGLTAVLTMLDGANPYHIDPGEAKDVRIQWASEIGTPGAAPTGDDGALGRAVCTDTSGALWVGMFNTQRYYKVNPTTGAVMAGPINTPGHTPYGCQVDVNGKLWSVDEDDYNPNTLVEIDTKASAPVAISHPLGVAKSNYSLSIFNDCSTAPPQVKVYLSDRSAAPKTYRVYDPQTSSFSSAPGSVPAFDSVAVAVDSHGDVISGEHLGSGRIIKTSASGNVVWTQSGTGHPISDLHGLIIDANDDVWAIDLHGNQVIKYSGATGAFIQAVAVGNMPYTYGNPPPPTCSGGSTTSTPTPCAQVTDKEIRCLPGGGYSYIFDVANNSGRPMSQVLLTPAQGAPFALSPQLSNLGSALPDGQSTTVIVSIANAKPGDKVCFFVSLMSDNAPCCTVQVCPTMPRCGPAVSPPPSRPPHQLPKGKRPRR